MPALAIRLIAWNYENDVGRTQFPSWDDIENTIRTLAERSGRIDIHDDSEDGLIIMVEGSPGFYALDVMKNDDNATMLVHRNSSTDATVTVWGEEYRKDQVVFDLQLVIDIVKHLIDHNEYLETDEFVWNDRAI